MKLRYILPIIALILFWLLLPVGILYMFIIFPVVISLDWISEMSGIGKKGNPSIEAVMAGIIVFYGVTGYIIELFIGWFSRIRKSP